MWTSPVSSGWTFHEPLHAARLRGPANQIRHVDGEEIAGTDEPVHSFETDMVSIHVVRPLPAQSFHGFIGRRSALAGSDPMMVCSRFDLFHTGITSTPASRSLHACLQLGPRLMGKPVTYTDRILWKHHRSIHEMHLQYNWYRLHLADASVRQPDRPFFIILHFDPLHRRALLCPFAKRNDKHPVFNGDTRFLFDSISPTMFNDFGLFPIFSRPLDSQLAFAVRNNCELRSARNPAPPCERRLPPTP